VIHCTPVTGSLLREITKVRRDLVEPHELGQPFRLPGCTVTFLDANHCPGSAMVLFECDGGRGGVHLHCGDMRFCPSMTEEPRLQSARVDRLFLDTTYAHPRHSFVPQEEAISAIVSAVREKLKEEEEEQGKRWVFLFGAYSIGKERVLLAVARATGLRVYCSERRLSVLRLLGLDPRDLAFFTRDPSARLHMCGMGVCGTAMPYAQPNYPSMQKYVREQGLDGSYDAVLGVVPTGWAGSSKWNREHPFMVNEEADAAVMFVPYSEHSSFPELQSLVRFLRPKKVVPTVFSDDRDREAIIRRFSSLVDVTANKRDFIAKMAGGGAATRKRPKALAASWDCAVCTFRHSDPVQFAYLSCKLCGSSRSCCEK
jgi:hypothetical protein